MAVQRVSSRAVGIVGALAVMVLVLAYVGVQYIIEEGYGLVYEIAYVLLLLIALTIAVDRLLVR